MSLLAETFIDLKTLLALYCIKYMHTLHKMSKNVKGFQKVLLGISNWNPKNVEMEYKKFLKWSNKRKINDFEKQIKTYLQHKILSISKNSFAIDIDYNKLFFKCIKRIAKIYYRNPKDIYSISKNKVIKVIEYTIHSLIPLHKLLELVQAYDSSSIYSYQIDDLDNNVTDEENCSNEICNSSIHLKYIPSEEFFNEYYESEVISTNENKNIKDIFLKKK